MAFVSRANAEALIPQDVAANIVQQVAEGSAVMSLATRAPDMSTAQTRIPVLSALPQAYFLNAGADPSDTGRKQTTNAEWANTYLNAEELAVIVPVPENVIADASYDIFGQITPMLVTAFGKAFDQAVLYSTNKPNAWPVGIVPQAIAKGNTVASGTGADLYDDLLSTDGLVATVEEDGYMVNGYIGALQARARLRGLRGSDGHPIFMQNMQQAGQYVLDGQPIYFPRTGAVDPSTALLIAGDWTKLIYAMRQDLTIKVFTEGVVQAPDGTILHNLMQNDMVALRAVMRVAWTVPDSLNYQNSANATRFPFGVLEPAVTP